jgi:hypothetical protein
MKDHGLLHKGAWLVAAGVIILIAAHGVVLYYLSSHPALSAAVVSGVIILVVVKHFGVLGRLSALLKRRARRNAPPDHS